jgi:hypothetical protein
MGSMQSSPVPGGGTGGYHVLRVQEGSPGYHAGLEAFFDFIIAIENTRLNQDNENLKELLKANQDKPVKMLVYNSKQQACREVTIVPSLNWGGQGLLGVSIRFCSFEGANENVWHVLDVEPNSPAALAGFRAQTDYIIGSDTMLNETDDLFALVESSDGRPVKLYLYNSETDSCRETTITPNSAWGGEGLLGCGIGYGYLHRIPSRHLPPEEETHEALQSFTSEHKHGGGGAHSHSHTCCDHSAVLEGHSEHFSEVPLNGSDSHHGHSHGPPAKLPFSHGTLNPPTTEHLYSGGSYAPTNMAQYPADTHMAYLQSDNAVPSNTFTSRAITPPKAPIIPFSQSVVQTSTFTPSTNHSEGELHVSHSNPPAPPTSAISSQQHQQTHQQFAPPFRPEPPIPLPTFAYHPHVTPTSNPGVPPSFSPIPPTAYPLPQVGSTASYFQPGTNVNSGALPSGNASSGLPGFNTSISLPGMPPLNVHMPAISLSSGPPPTGPVPSGPFSKTKAS